ncbi:MAG: hypothetical protein AAB724_03135, partial [Patescibacteria group bacterium]
MEGMVKIFNLKTEEEITSVTERLWETAADEVFLVAPDDSVLLRNIIGLKLLKREADRLGKEVTIVAQDEVGREMAKRAGLASRVSLPKKKRLAEEELEEEEETLKEVPMRKFESMIEKEVNA